MPETMRAVQISEKESSPGGKRLRRLELVELPIPEPAKSQVRLRVHACGVCHTDLHILDGEIHPPKLPIIPGHQVVGVVEALCPGRRPEEGPRIGERVGVPWFYDSDGVCRYCRKGQENLCPNARFTGFDVNGGYAETMLAEADTILALPDSLSDEQAAPLLCAGIIGYRSLRQAGLLPGERLGLVGFGASAHLAIQVARHWDCEVFVFTRSPEHRRHAEELGAAWVGGAEDPAPQPLDRAVIFAPAGRLVPLMLEKLRPAGTLAINAIYMSDIPAFPYQSIYQERTLRSVANATYQDGVDFLKIAAEIPITSTVTLYPLEQVGQALADLKHSRLNGEAVLQI
jgi:propanol-preferring alcohol dehydrogenase